MLAKESLKFDLPDELLEVLPEDPFDQLDVARKITSIALSRRVDDLESLIYELRQQLGERDAVISGLEEKLESLSDAAEKLAAAQKEKEKLIQENEQLSSTVKKLNRDVAKLEVFRKTLMKSLQEDEDNPASAQKAAAAAHIDENKVVVPQSQLSDAVGKGDTETEIVRQRSPLKSQRRTPVLTPTGSPPNLSPLRTPPNLSPTRRHSVSLSTSRSLSDDKTLVSSASSGKARVDGKEFFRLVRTRLSYERFGEFLNNVKELNSHKQTKEETVRKADEIFGPENKDLYTIFEGLILRNVQ